jgi:hypothetical protein
MNEPAKFLAGFFVPKIDGRRVPGIISPLCSARWAGDKLSADEGGCPPKPRLFDNRHGSNVVPHVGVRRTGKPLGWVVRRALYDAGLAGSKYKYRASAAGRVDAMSKARPVDILSEGGSLQGVRLEAGCSHVKVRLSQSGVDFGGRLV